MAKTTSKSKTAYYASYKSSTRWAANRKKRLARALKEQPNNAEQIQLAMADVKYRRRTPTNTMWKASQKRIAQLFKEVAGQCPHAVFSSNDKVSAEALATMGRNKQYPKKAQPANINFSLGARAHDRNGNLVWSQ